jgi:RNA polymerase sigma factor (sigma-70 family)
VDEQAWLTERFEEHRPRLRAVAYRMLGSVSEADDAVQDAWLRVSRAGADDVENLGGWLTTIVARVCLNQLRSRAARREDPLDVHVPDPIISPASGLDPEQEALLADSVGLALLVVLETLAPAERLAFVLHDMFAVPFDEEALVAVLDPDVVLRADGGGARNRPTVVVRGARAVAGQAVLATRFAPFARPALVNGAAGVVTVVNDKVFSVMGFTVSGGKVVAIDVLYDPLRVEALGD